MNLIFLKSDITGYEKEKKTILVWGGFAMNICLENVLIVSSEWFIKLL